MHEKGMGGTKSPKRVWGVGHGIVEFGAVVGQGFSLPYIAIS